MDKTASKKKRPYSLHKSFTIQKWVYKWYKKKGHTLSNSQLTLIESDMMALDRAMAKSDKIEASTIARRLEAFANENCKKSIFDYIIELIFALVFALVIAVIVRAMWFEPYEIPTGSMRPTFKEQDHLTVTKTAFGVNIPLMTDHFYFDPDLVQRTSILIFSGDGLPLRDVDTTYFGIFPYKKRYIKRLIGKPGDSIYFYGGKLYGVDKEGNDILELRDSPWMQPLEHVPFLSFEGDLSSGKQNSILFNQFHHPLGRVALSPLGQINSDIFTGKEWVKDQPLAQTKPHTSIETYSDFYGMRNYAEARLLTKEELNQLPNLKNYGEFDDGVLYLQLHHTPSLAYPKPIVQREGQGVAIGISGYSTIIPLQQSHLDAIMKNLYTARFVIANGRGRKYSAGDEHFAAGNPKFPNVPDGTYEFYFGDLSRITWGGIALAGKKDNPLYSRDPANIQKLFNLGLEMNTVFSPSPNNETLFPHRYAYFRDGDLYMMGAPILKKDDPILVKFKEHEEKRQAQSTVKSPYVAFRDYGPPMKDGKIDVEFIRTFGITVPEKSYMVLGDNHAMSSDSRVFGFVSEKSLQGAPYWIIWPPGDRLGAPPQKPYPFMNIPRFIIWSAFAIIASLVYAYNRWQRMHPVFKPIIRR